MWTLKKGEKEIEIVPGKRILRADEFLTFGKATAIIDETKALVQRSVADAEARARQIIGDAQAKAKEITDGAQAAFEEERKKGHAAGMEEGKQELANLMMEIAAKKMESFEKFEESIINIVMRSIKRILGEMDNEQLLTAVVHNALSSVRNQKRVIVRVNPDQAPKVRETVETMIKRGDDSTPFIEVIADGRLQKNSCLIETEIGTVDASLAVQLKAIEKALQKHAAQG
jgi:type III secretion protein L